MQEPHRLLRPTDAAYDLELHLRYTRLGAFRVVLAAAGAARRARDADRADHAVARADRDTARRRGDVRQEDGPEVGKLLHALAVVTGRHLVGERGVRLAEAVHFGVRRGA